MDIPRKKSFLIDLVETLSLSDLVQREYTKNGKDKTTKLAYVQTLQAYYLTQRYGSLDNVPEYMKLALYYWVQKASPRNNLKPKSKQPEIWADMWNNPDYIVEEKLDGVRFVSIFVRGEGLHTFSRHIDAVEFLPIEYTANYLTRFDESKLIGIDSFILDSELVCPNHDLCQLLSLQGVTAETQLSAVASLMHMNPEASLELQRNGAIVEPHVFDCMYLNGQDLRQQPLHIRRREMLARVEHIQASGFDIILHKSYMISRDKKQMMFDKIIARNGEGLIAKHINSVYTPDGRNNDWIKIKRTVSLTGDTISAYITGYKPGKSGSDFENLIGSVEISTNVILESGDIEEHSIGWLKSFALTLRKDMTHYDDQGFPILNPEYYGKVVDVDGQNFSSRSKHLNHARIIDWRPDLTPEHCSLKQTTINELIF